MRRVGLLGGTFDPPHIGHAIVADQVGAALGLDEVRLVPANRPWQKVGTRNVTSAAHRLGMTKALVSDLLSIESGPGASVRPMTAIVASDTEIELGGPSFTMVTLQHLWSTEPDTEFTVIVGSDTAAGLDTWHRAESLQGAVRFAVVSRPARQATALPPDPPGYELVHVEAPAIDISSTDLRDRVAQGRSIRFLTTPGVIALVSQWGLYRPGL